MSCDANITSSELPLVSYIIKKYFYTKIYNETKKYPNFGRSHKTVHIKKLVKSPLNTKSLSMNLFYNK